MSKEVKSESSRKFNIESTESRIKVRVKKLYDNAKLPEYGTEYAAGADLYANEIEAGEQKIGEEVIIESGETVFIHTGIAMEIPVGLAGHIYARSGLSCKKGLAPANKVGVIDSDYRGEIIVALHNHGVEPREVHIGDKVAQLEIVKVNQVIFEEAEELNDTVRGAGGFGSTGK